MNKEDFIIQTAKELYLKEPRYRRKHFMKWYRKNNWFIWAII